MWSCISEEQDSEHGAIGGKTQTHMTEYYNLDVIISVGYRVKSKRGVEFRRWANSVLKKYILQGYAVNDNRIVQLGEVIRVMKNRKLSGMEVNTK
nr:RhuM family protein [Mogibacterium sp.]